MERSVIYWVRRRIWIKGRWYKEEREGGEHACVYVVPQTPAPRPLSLALSYSMHFLSIYWNGDEVVVLRESCVPWRPRPTSVVSTDPSGMPELHFFLIEFIFLYHTKIFATYLAYYLLGNVIIPNFKYKIEMWMTGICLQVEWSVFFNDCYHSQILQHAKYIALVSITILEWNQLFFMNWKHIYHSLSYNIDALYTCTAKQESFLLHLDKCNYNFPSQRHKPVHRCHLWSVFSHYSLL